MDQKKNFCKIQGYSWIVVFILPDTLEFHFSEFICQVETK